MNPIGKDIAEMIVSEIGTLQIGRNLFVGAMPVHPVDVVCVYETSGSQPDSTLDGETLFNDAVQIIVRASSYLAGQTLCQHLIQALHNRGNELWNDTWYLFILLQNGPNQLMGDGDIDNRKRAEHKFSLNFRIKRNDTIEDNPSISL